ncbi:MAG: hypothetical protein H0X38_06140 [Planctomycetes bacterium]|nr:hypothetical protein [Planctomycetota bacterium]
MHQRSPFAHLAAESSEPLFSHGGQAGHRLQRLDWTTTSLGVPASWSPRLHAVLEMCLESDVPMAICWQRELALLHNDAFQPFLGPQSSAMQGQAARTIYAETWHQLKDAFLLVMNEGRSVQVSDRHMPLAFRIPYPPGPILHHFSPIRGGDGRVAGTCVIVTGLHSQAPGIRTRLP